MIDRSHLKCFLVTGLSFGLVLLSQPSEATTRHTPDMLTEQQLAYPRSAELMDISRDSASCPFIIKIDATGIGHLQSNYEHDSDYPRAKNINLNRTPGGLLEDFVVRTTFLKPGTGWKPLTRVDAEQLWGPPRKHTIRNNEFCTFDAHSIKDGEENIYHLDLRFDDRGAIAAYRIRGVGIPQPQWVLRMGVNDIWVDTHPAAK